MNCENVHSFLFSISLDTFSGNVGLAISQALILTGMVQFGIRQCAETMQQMTSVERIIEYTKLEPVKYFPRNSLSIESVENQ